jgi:ectoine hydroxylase-related dioxygenase (phytanoyl-CoA dioxygenase family)
MEGIAEAVRENGFAVVRGLLGPEARRRVLEEEARLKARGAGGWMDRLWRLGRRRRDRPLVWSKDRAVRSPAFRALGAGEAVLSLVRPVLGEDVVLWGTDVLVRPPSCRHPWHSDIESCDPGGGFLSVWIGIEGTTARSSLHLVAGSHRLGTTVQEQAQRHGRGRGEAGDEEVMGWARALDPSVRLERPALGDGDALVFDGRLWHGSHNAEAEGTRTALLLQYARADRPVRTFDARQLDWPFRYLDRPRLPVVLVSGRAAAGVNLVVGEPA